MTHLSKRFAEALLCAALLLTHIAVVPLLQANDLSSTAQKLHFDQLKLRLVNDGISSDAVDSWFSDDRFEVISSLLRVNVRQPSATAGYSRFLGEESVQQASEFLIENRGLLEGVLAGSPVDPAVVVAILQVESSLGKYKGTYPLFNVFASLTLLEAEELSEVSPTFWDEVLRDIPEAEHPAMRSRAKDRARSKSRWAYRELRALFTMAEKGQLDPLETRGSWAGAFGMSQFLPTSAQAYARDGDGDGRIDLDKLPDAAASIANYLKVHRYSRTEPAKRRKAVWHYNHSDEYVECILTLADKIEERVATAQ